MRILTMQQRTPEWEIARKGRITASSMDKVLAGPNTKGRFEYMMNLILDLEGIGDFKDSAPWFDAGRQYEHEALGWYQIDQNVDVQHIGFALHDEYNWFGCSPDGLIARDTITSESTRCTRGLELKFRSTLETFHDSNIKPIPRAYEYQVQACIWVCNAEEWHYVNYWRDPNGQREQGHVRVIERDEAKIREIEEAAMSFWRETVRTYRGRTKKDFIEYPYDVWRRTK